MWLKWWKGFWILYREGEVKGISMIWGKGEEERKRIGLGCIESGERV